jgi:hypothetical protein
MKPRTVTLLLTGAAIAAVLCGCARAPLQMLHEAEKSLEEARKAGAELYAFSRYKAAQVSLELAKREISEENKKLPFLRKYKKTAETLGSAVRAAKSARAAVEVAKTQIRHETQEVIGNARGLADTIRSMLKKIPGRTIGTLRAELDSATTMITRAEKSLGKGNLLMAKENAAVAQLKMTALAKNVRSLLPRRTSKAKLKKKR